MKAIAISALSSGQGKTLFTIALLNWLKNNFGAVRSYKVGPDYIDTRFHEKITGIPSINLDLYMASEDEVKDSFFHYAQGKSSLVVEGVMGFYDGMDYGTSTYDVTRVLDIPVVLIISAEGSYSSIIPTINGTIDYKSGNTIKGIILNKVSSEKHYQIIKKQVQAELPNLEMLGWIPKNLPVISSRHLGLDLTELNSEKLNELSESVMKNIDITKLMNFMEYNKPTVNKNIYYTKDINLIVDITKELVITIVNDDAFSFLYAQNVDFIENIFGKVYKVSAINNETINQSSDVVYIPGGYIETPEVSSLLHNADLFKQSLKAIIEAENKKIYAECAGLMFLGNKIQTTDGEFINGMGALPLNFEIQKTRHRLGYYKAIDRDDLTIYKGHSFHYSRPVTIDNTDIVKWGLFKNSDSNATPGGWANEKGNIFGTYLHTFFFNQPDLIMKYFVPCKKACFEEIK